MDLFFDHEDEQYMLAEAARALSKGKPYNLKGIGKITKDAAGYHFTPGSKLDKLITAAGKYSGKVIPYNAETKALWAIDTIGDGGLHIMDEDVSVFYLGQGNGKLIIIDKTSVSDEYDDLYDDVLPDAVQFDRKNAKPLNLLCPTEPWAIKDMVFEKTENYRQIAEAFHVSTEEFEAAMHKFLASIDKELQKEAVEYSEGPLFVRKIRCALDLSNLLLQIIVDDATTGTW
jgi:hypothetical protein